MKKTYIVEARSYQDAVRKVQRIRSRDMRSPFPFPAGTKFSWPDKGIIKGIIKSAVDETFETVVVTDLTHGWTEEIKVSATDFENAARHGRIKIFRSKEDSKKHLR